jgi:aldose 1-epimerase
MPQTPSTDRTRARPISSILLMTALGACGGKDQQAAQPAAPPPPAAGGEETAQAGAPSEPAPPAKPAPISKATYGQVDGKDVELYTLTNSKGLVLKVTSFGATITEFHVPDRDGKMADIVNGFDKVDDYAGDKNPYFGATVGRVANRIKGAKFKLDGKTYKLAMNNPDTKSHLHGGTKGWNKVIWTAETKEGEEGPSIKLSYVSPDGEEGYPGTVNAMVTYTLTNANELRVEMEAVTDKPTIINMAHHTYWNLGGTGSGSIEDHELTLHADKITPGLPPTSSKTKAVKGTPFDFNSPKPIGQDLKSAGGDPVGYDHNWVVTGDPHSMRPVARVKDPKSGRVMELEADQPGVQFYTGNFMDGSTSGKGATHTQYSAFCLESQKFPNSINIPAWKKEVILKPGETYKSTMVHKFSTE